MEEAASPEDAARHDIGERHRAEEEMDLVAELFPEVMGEAARLAALAADRGARRAARRADRLVHREHDVGDPRVLGGGGEEIAAARPADAAHQPGLAHPGE